MVRVPDQIATLIKQEGIFLCGGGAKLSGLDAFLYAHTNLAVRVVNTPEDTSVMGGLLFVDGHN